MRRRSHQNDVQLETLLTFPNNFFFLILIDRASKVKVIQGQLKFTNNSTVTLNTVTSILALVKVVRVCCVLVATPRLKPTRLLGPWDFPSKILEWNAISSSRESSRPRDRTEPPLAPALTGEFFTTEPPEKPLISYYRARTEVRWSEFHKQMCAT